MSKTGFLIGDRYEALVETLENKVGSSGACEEIFLY